MNILEQLNLVKKHPQSTVKVTTLGELEVGEVFEFVSRMSIKTGDLIYICSPRDFVYGRAVIVNNPTEALYKAKRTS